MICHIKSTPYHHQTNGLVERFNGTLRNMLRTAKKSEQNEWDELLPYLLLAYREIPHESSGFSPFELLYGRPISGPLDVIWEQREGRSFDKGVSVVSHITQMQRRMKEDAVQVRYNIQKAQKNQKFWYDKGAREKVLEVEEKGLVLLPLKTRWRHNGRGLTNLVVRRNQGKRSTCLKD